MQTNQFLDELKCVNDLKSIASLFGKYFNNTSVAYNTQNIFASIFLENLSILHTYIILILTQSTPNDQ